MTETSLVQLGKRRNELENQLSLITQKEATLEKELKLLEGELAAQLEEKIKAKYAAVDKLESVKSDLETRLAKLREQPKTSVTPEEPLPRAPKLEEQPAEPSKVQSTRIRALCLLAVLTIVSIALVYFLMPESDTLTFLSNSIRPIVACASLLTSLLALHKYWQNLDSRLTRIWLCFTVGMAFWLLSELTWAVLTMGFNIPNPYPSTANVYRLIGYGALFLAIILYLGMFHPVVSPKTVAISAAATLPTSVGIIPTILLLIGGRASQINSATLVVAFTSPLLDLLLFAIAILCLLVFTITPLRGKLKGAWLLLNAGILMNVLGDLTLSYTNLSGIYFQGHPLELFFAIGYILFALAFYMHTKEF